MGKPKINSEVRNKLFSADPKVVVETINSLSYKGNAAYLPLLFEFLLADPEMEVKKAVLKLLGTIKDKDTVPSFIDALQNEKFVPIKKDILTTCWQNGLDFSPFLEVFVDIIVTCEWEIAFEAFTVIENLEYFPPLEELKDIKLKIARELKKADEQKAYFLEEILKLAP